MCTIILQMLYESVAAGVMFYALVCRGSNVKVANTTDWIIHQEGRLCFTHGAEATKRRMLSKLL